MYLTIPLSASPSGTVIAKSCINKIQFFTKASIVSDSWILAASLRGQDQYAGLVFGNKVTINDTEVCEMLVLGAGTVGIYRVCTSANQDNNLPLHVTWTLEQNITSTYLFNVAVNGGSEEFFLNTKRVVYIYYT